ncbi:MAG: 50S ribosomal protein L23 [Cytophagales bacterium]|nr:50S ribosomal protein L23 [Cytophagales bacterium]
MNILKKPLVTEKIAALNEKGVYGFVVDKKANKIEIKKAVENTYMVSVERVNTMIYPGKKKTKYTKSKVIKGKTPSYKKAIVTLKEGEVIDFYGSIQ